MKAWSYSLWMAALLGCIILPIHAVAKPSAIAPPTVEQNFVADEDVPSSPATENGDLGVLAFDQLEMPRRAALPEELEDTSFERYVDLRLVGEALAARDASLLADVALQFAEAERVLLRNHQSGLTAKKLIRKAAQLAGATQDIATLERLAIAAEAAHDSGLLAELQAAQKLAGKSRATDPAFSVSLETTDRDTLIDLKGWLDVVQDAALLGDKLALQALREEVGEHARLSPSQRQAIAKRITEALETATEDEEDVLLLKLTGASRDVALNRRISEFCYGQLNKKVGRGECTDLVDAAYRHAGAKPFHQLGPSGPDADYVWGTLIASLEASNGLTSGFRQDAVRPGDVIQFRNARFQRRTSSGTRTQNARHHTAVVHAVHDGGNSLFVLHQNSGSNRFVTAGLYTLDSLKSGSMKIYRPIRITVATPRTPKSPRLRFPF